MQIKYSILLSCLILSGCSTPYIKGDESTHGYHHIILEPNVYQVSFQGNTRTSVEKIKDLALLRAAEITMENNCPYFDVIHSENPSESLKSSQLIYMNYESDSSIRDNSTHNQRKLMSTLVVKCSETKRVPSGILYTPSQLYAPQIQESLKKKYAL